MTDLNTLIAMAKELNASDVHIVSGLPVRCRVDGSIRNLTEETLTFEDCENYGRAMAGPRFSEIEEMGELDLAQSFPCGARTRINLFRQQGSLSAAIRLLAERIPELEELNLPPVVASFPDYRSGIVLVTGETGSGKSTTLAAILNRINHTRCAHIITLEDPIEYVYHPDKCIINQRQIGSDTHSYADGLRSILREDPDVILIGEMRDLNTIETALTAAETGHLVFATLHTVVSQQLLPRKGGHGRAAACEIMVVNAALKNLIREGKTPQMDSFITMNSQNGSILMDAALQKMVREGTITQAEAIRYARDPETVQSMRRY